MLQRRSSGFATGSHSTKRKLCSNLGCHLTVLLIIVVGIELLPVSAAPTRQHVSDAVRKYLSKYGYLQTDETTKTRIGDLSEAVRRFQVDTGSEPTGELSKPDLELMRKPRCGNQFDKNKHTRRRRRFVTHRRKWRKSQLVWKLQDPQGLLQPYDKYVIRNTLHRAFNIWAMASRGTIRFREIPAESEKIADIVAFFATGAHNDTLPFDGKDGVVAHGFYPTDGNLHFDASEKWTLNMDDGVNLYQTAVHEIGHLMGLEHSADGNAIMFPINRPYEADFRLSVDDVRGIRYLYSPWAWRHYFKQYLARLRRISERFGSGAVMSHIHQ